METTPTERAILIERTLDRLDLTGAERELLMTHTTTVTVWKDPANVAMIAALWTRVPVLPKPITLYSGSERPVDPDADTYDIATYPYFTSSTNPDIAHIYAMRESPPVVFYITVPAGARVLPLWTLSFVPEECEVLLDHRALRLRADRRETITFRGESQHVVHVTAELL